MCLENVPFIATRKDAHDQHVICNNGTLLAKGDCVWQVDKMAHGNKYPPYLHSNVAFIAALELTRSTIRKSLFFLLVSFQFLCQLLWRGFFFIGLGQPGFPGYSATTPHHLPPDCAGVTMWIAHRQGRLQNQGDQGGHRSLHSSGLGNAA